MKRLFLLLLLACRLYATSTEQVNDILGDVEVWNVLPTGSMEPAFNEKWCLLTKKLPFDKIRVTDVILVKVTGYSGPICHRVIRKSSGGSVLVTMGDANHGEDSWLVTESMYLGTVVGIVRLPENG